MAAQHVAEISAVQPMLRAPNDAVLVHAAPARPAATAGARQGAYSRRVFELDVPVTENSLKIAPDGSVFVGITAATAGDNGGFLRTRDRGASWQLVVPRIAGDDGMVLNAAMGSIAIDPRSSRLFASSMGDPSCAVESEWARKIAKLLRRDESWSDTLAFSDDGGEHFAVVRGQFRDGGDWGKTFLGPPATAASRAQLALHGYPSVVYHCAGATFSITSYCWKSLDGGVTFQRTKSPVFSVYRARTPLPYPAHPDPEHVRDDRHTLAGPGVVTSDGSVYVPANIDGFARIYCSRDEGDSWTHLPIPVAHVRGKKSYGEITGFQEPPNAGRPLRPQQPFHALYGSTAMSALWSQQLAADAQDTLYLGWIDARDDLPYLSISRDRGRSWSASRMVAPPGVNMASIAAIAVREPGEIAIAYYGSRDGGQSFDGMLTVSCDAFSDSPTFASAATSPDAPLQPNRLSEPIELIGVDFAPDGSVWSSFARDLAVLDESSPERQCDGNFRYNGDRYRAVVMALQRIP